MMSPAYIAPGTLPKPPSVTTTKAVSPNVSPTEGDHGYDIAISAPAMPALPAASPQASACMRSGRMPISIAALRSSATARSWLPTVVRVSKRCSAKVSAIAATPATSCGTGIRMPATLSVPDNETCGSETKFAEKIQKAV